MVKVIKIFNAILKKNGYDVMVDIGGVGTKLNREGVDPLIIFDPNETLSCKKIKEVKPEFFKAYNVEEKIIKLGKKASKSDKPTFYD